MNVRGVRANGLHKLAAAEFFYVMTYATYTYLTVFLMDIGYGSEAIGLMTSVGAVLAMACLPLLGYISDRIGSPKFVLIGCVALSGIFFIALLFVDSATAAKGLFPTILFVSLLYMARAPSMALLDAWVVAKITPLKLHYGYFRVFGSLGYAALSITLSWVLNGRSVTPVFIINAVVVALLIGTCLSVREVRAPLAKTAREAAGIGALLRNRRFLQYLVLLCGLHIYSAISLVFMVYIVVGAALPGTMVGLVLGYARYLEHLSCADNDIYRLDLLYNGNLKTLNCANNQLTFLDTSRLNGLVELDCSNNSLPQLSSGNAQYLEQLNCANNQLTALDTALHTQLKALDCSGNAIEQLDVSANGALVELKATDNLLAALDLSANGALKVLHLAGNYIPGTAAIAGLSALSLDDFIFAPQHVSAPTAPGAAGVRLQSTQSLALFWDASEDYSGIDYYDIYRDGVQVGTSHTAEYTDTGLTPGASYTYSVCAVNVNGVAGPMGPSSVQATLEHTVRSTVMPNDVYHVETADTIAVRFRHHRRRAVPGKHRARLLQRHRVEPGGLWRQRDGQRGHAKPRRQHHDRVLHAHLVQLGGAWPSGGGVPAAQRVCDHAGGQHHRDTHQRVHRHRRTGRGVRAERGHRGDRHQHHRARGHL
ncbi:MAG: MFS transporter [Oscillospiraceae bacterium]